VRVLLAAVLGLGVIAATGCGGGSERLSATEYRTQLDHLGERAREAQEELARGLTATSVAQLEGILAEFAQEEQAIAQEVAGLDPPKAAEDANAQLAIAQHRFAAAFVDVLPTLEAARTVEAARAKLRRSEEFAVAGQQVDHAISVLKKLGYMSNAEEEET
jgi:hypothetical protein